MKNAFCEDHYGRKEEKNLGDNEVYVRIATSNDINDKPLSGHNVKKTQL